MAIKRQSREDYMTGNLMRRKIFSLCYQIGWIYGGQDAKEHVDKLRLNSWMLRMSYLRKPLEFYTPDELPKLVTQFEEMSSKIIVQKNAKQ